MIIIPTKKAVLYLRYSSSSQTEQSIEGQDRSCREFADRNGFTIIDSYIDRAKSASRDIGKRTEFLRMIDDARRGRFDAVIVYKVDRFARDRYDAAIYKEKLKKAGVQLVSATESLGSGPESIIMESVLEGFAQYYSAELSQKVKRGQRESAEKRKFLGGPVPFGFKSIDARLVPDPDVVPVVQKMFEMAAAGKTFKEIADVLTSLGYTTNRGKPMNGQAVYRILHAKRYIGYYCYDGHEIPDVYEPFISRELWDKVQIRIEHRKHRKKKYMDHEYLLSGKLFCGHCGEPMLGESGKSHTGKVHHYYACYGKKIRHSGCHKKNVRQDDIESFIIEKAREQLNDDLMGNLTNMIYEIVSEKYAVQDRIPALTDQVKEIDQKIANLIRAVENGFASPALAGRMRNLEDEKADLELQIQREKSRQSAQIQKEDIAQWLVKAQNAEVESDQMLIDAFIKRVELFDDEDKKNRKVKIYFTLYDDGEEFEYDFKQSAICYGSELFIVSDRFIVLVKSYMID